MKIFKDMTRISNLRNEVNAKVDSFANTLKMLGENMGSTQDRLDNDMQMLKQTMNEEMKDMRSANKAFSFELDRSQNLYRALQQELVLTMEEKKT